MDLLHHRFTQDNTLLSSLPRDDRESLERYLEPVTLKPRQRLEAANRKIENVCFIDDGLVSIVAVEPSKRHQAEIAVVGREGLTGTLMVVGAQSSPHEAVVQIEGRGRRIPASVLRDLVQKSPSLLPCLLRYVSLFANQVQATARANARGTIEERLARWLLMAQDRLDCAEVHIAHAHLSYALGVRRAGIDEALNHFESSALIANSRRCVAILDRAGLRERANGLY
jgi:CRP-like cAMP-binding protein